MKTAVALLVLLVVSSGYFVNEAFAEISENQAFLLEGSGFAVTEEIIRISEIDLGLSSQDQRGSTINFLTEDGFITLDNEEFLISNLQGKFLREGKYIRINGEIESSKGFDTSISFFGRLVSESKDAAVYGITGRITTSDDTYKVIYTTKLSSLTKIIQTDSETQESTDVTLYILRGSSSQGLGASYNEGTGSLREEASTTQRSDDSLRLRYFSQDRISVEPGTTINIVNDDVVSHSIVSGIILGSERDLNKGKICTDVDTTLPEGFSFMPQRVDSPNCDFVLDNRIITDVILPGKSVSVTFDDPGFYRLIDPDYGWMSITAYVFPNSDNLIFGKGKNLVN
jgi:plastocyanin